VNNQTIQKVVFPHGLVVIPENRAYLTDNMNQVFSLIPFLQSVSEGGKKEKASKIADLSLSVARTVEISNLILKYYIVVELHDYLL
jgi:hypothetical protein